MKRGDEPRTWPAMGELKLRLTWQGDYARERGLCNRRAVARSDALVGDRPAVSKRRGERQTWGSAPGMIPRPWWATPFFGLATRA